MEGVDSKSINNKRSNLGMSIHKTPTNVSICKVF